MIPAPKAHPPRVDKPAQDKPVVGEGTMNFRGMVPQRVLAISDLSRTERRQYHRINGLLRNGFHCGNYDFLPRGITLKILTLLRIVK